MSDSDTIEMLYPELVFTSFGGANKYKFMPTQDITPWEVAKFLELFTYATSTKKGCDWESFMYDNKLQRHFVEYKEGEK